MNKSINEHKSIFRGSSFINIHDFYVTITSYFNRNSKNLGGVVFETNFNKFLQSWDNFITSSITMQVRENHLEGEFELYLPVHLYNVQDIDKFQDSLDFLNYSYIPHDNRIHFKLVSSSLGYLPEEIFTNEEVKSLNIPDKGGFKQLTFLKMYFNCIDNYPSLLQNLQEFKTHYKNSLNREKNLKEAESILSNSDSRYHKIKNSLYSISRAEQELLNTKAKLIHQELDLREVYRGKIAKSMTKMESFNGTKLLTRSYGIASKGVVNNKKEGFFGLDEEDDHVAVPMPEARNEAVQEALRMIVDAGIDHRQEGHLEPPIEVNIDRGIRWRINNNL